MCKKRSTDLSSEPSTSHPGEHYRIEQKEIVSPFTTKLSSKLLNLIPTEMQIASLVKDGRNSYEIAELMNRSPNTILFPRHNLRSKLDLKQRKVNLRSYLRSLQD